MTEEQFALYYKEWEAPIRRMARKEAFGDRDLADDMAQEAAIALSEFEPGEEVENEEAFIRTMLYRRMCNVRRAEWRAAGLVTVADVPPKREQLQLERGENLDRGDDIPEPSEEKRGTRCRGSSRRAKPHRDHALPQRREVPRHRNATPSSGEW